MKKFTTIFIMSLLVMFFPVTINAAEEDSKVAKTITRTINGTDYTLTVYENKDIYFKKGTLDSIDLYWNAVDLQFDKYGTVWVISSVDNGIRWWNYDLTPDREIFSIISSPTENAPNAYVTDVESLVLDDNQEFVVGYKTTSGETYPILTLEEMKSYWGITDNSTPSPTVKPSSTPVVTTDDKPVVAPSVTTNTKVTVKKKSGFTCLYTGTKVTSQYKLKKGNLTWKSGKKVKKFMGIKSAGFIKKSKNLIFMTKSGKVYTISSKGKKKTIVKKGAKKLIFSGKFVTKVKKKSGSVNVTRK